MSLISGGFDSNLQSAASYSAKDVMSAITSWLLLLQENGKSRAEAHATWMMRTFCIYSSRRHAAADPKMGILSD